MRSARFWLLAAGGLLAVPAVASAQNVEFTPRADESAERRLAAFLEQDVYEIFDGDTVLLAGQFKEFFYEHLVEIVAAFVGYDSSFQSPYQQRKVA